ncbi:hypothetical protein [Mycoplasmopsis primatum]|uniref:hypothetical protein n=1 Tax=Mycoplasmopsis primatum TaxID=55604 RepID=UPI0012EB4068|nr:hypothetical protein [Mycoplasmopsis primatum]
MNFKDFQILHSETILYYQKIEQNLKLIYSYMSKVNSKKPVKDITNRSLGQTLTVIKDLDSLNPKQLLCPNDYIFLSKICENRNWWAHNNYSEFINIENFINSVKYQNQCNQLIKHHNRAKNAYDLLEKIKLKLQAVQKNKI